MPDAAQPESKRRRWHTPALILLAVLLLCVLLPPLVNLSHFDRKISASISSSLGRPVHLDHAGIRLLPTPALTMENFSVGENPSFGNEPVVRSSSVTATLRVSSLWHRHIEISSISLDEPSINITRNAAGEWNFKGILLQAAAIPTSPTDPHAPAAPARPRFPYIEATHARVNFILGNEKIPFSLTDSDLALWQSSDGKWRFRLRTTPSRTDLNLTDTGLLHAEGSLGSGDALPRITAWPDLPLDLQIRWDELPLGQLSRLFTGAGQDLSGLLQARASLTGSIAAAHLHADFKFNGLRAAEVVPADSLSLPIACDADQAAAFTRLDHLLCTLPLENSASLALSGSIANFRALDPANLLAPAAAQPDLTLVSNHLDAANILSLARNFTARIPDSAAINGPINVAFTYRAATPPHAQHTTAAQKYLWSGSIRGEKLSLTLPTTTATSLTTFFAPNDHSNVIAIRTLVFTTDPAKPRARNTTESDTTFSLAPIPLSLGAATPATLSAKFSSAAYTLTLTGAATQQKLSALQAAIPWLSTTDSTTAPSAPSATKSSDKEKSPAPIRVEISITQPWHQQ